MGTSTQVRRRASGRDAVLEATENPDLGGEEGKIIYGPGVEVGVALQTQRVLAVDVSAERVDVCVPDGGVRPKWLCHDDSFLVLEIHIDEVRDVLLLVQDIYRTRECVKRSVVIKSYSRKIYFGTENVR